MSFFAKKLLKVWIVFLTCFFTSISGSSATEYPDIAIMREIPDLVLSTKRTISCEILKFCRLAMYTIPMDSFSSDRDRNLTAPIPITQVVDIPDTFHPLQLFSNRELLKIYFGGRNIVITQDETNQHVMVVTGMGPKYNSLRKAEIERHIKTSIVDIIDVLPEIVEEQRISIRDFFVHHRNILELLCVLRENINGDSFQQIQDLMSEDLTIKEIMERSEVISGFEEVLSRNPSAIIPSANFTNEIDSLNTILQDGMTQEPVIFFINKLKALVKSHSAKQKQTALEELKKILKKIKNDTTYCYELIYQITALDEGTINSSLTGLKLIDPVKKGHQQALGDLFHSEPLYLLWKTVNSSAPRYFFTQRDMCTVCDQHICQSMLLSTEEVAEEEKSPFYVLSAKAGNTTGAASVDKVFCLNDTLSSWILKKKISLKDSTLFQNSADGFIRMKEKQKNETVRNSQLSKIERLRLPDLYIEQ